MNYKKLLCYALPIAITWHTIINYTTQKIGKPKPEHMSYEQIFNNSSNIIYFDKGIYADGIKVGKTDVTLQGEKMHSAKIETLDGKLIASASENVFYEADKTEHWSLAISDGKKRIGYIFEDPFRKGHMILNDKKELIGLSKGYKIFYDKYGNMDYRCRRKIIGIFVDRYDLDIVDKKEIPLEIVIMNMVRKSEVLRKQFDESLMIAH